MNIQQPQNGVKGSLRRDLIILFVKIAIFIPFTYTFIILEDFYQEHVVLARMAYAANAFLSANLLISLSRILLISWYRRRSRYFDYTVRGSFVLGVNRISSVLNAVFIVITAMAAFGIDLGKFLTSITLVAMAVTLIFKDYITNMISGLLIMFSDQLTIGDYIKMGDYQGKIIDITLVNIVLNNEDDDIVMIPNNLVFTTHIINQSFQNSRKVGVEFELPLDHAKDRDELRVRLENILYNQKGEVMADTVKLKVLAVEKDLVKYKVQFSLTNKGKIQSQFVKNIVLNEVLKINEE